VDAGDWPLTRGRLCNIVCPSRHRKRHRVSALRHRLAWRCAV